MNKFEEIRPIVLGLAIRDGELLVGESFDKVKKQSFYRCLGGGIEFLEKSVDALKREFKEEINSNVTIQDFLGVSENIFTYQGKNAHEIVFYYSVTVPDEDVKEEYYIQESKSIAKWVDIQDFKNGNKILYPEEVFPYIS